MELNNKTNSLNKTFEKGLYNKLVKGPDGFENRVHLRVDEDQSGVLWVNANQTFYLNPSACLFVWCLLNQLSEAETKKILKRHYPLDFTRVAADFEAFSPEIKRLLDGSASVCELCQSGIDSSLPFTAAPSAPYRMDLALTYACNNHCSHCYNEKERPVQSIPISDWERVLQKIASIGVPHVVFTGGEPTLVPQLPALARQAEKLGLVSGINTNGRRFADREFVRELADTGLDHIQITLESEQETIHDAMVGAPGAWRETITGIRNAVESGVFTMTNTTLLRSNATEEHVRNLISFVNQLGVRTVGINALIYSGEGKTVQTGLQEAELAPLLQLAQECCTANGQQLIWYTPTQYCHFDPQALDLGVKGCSAARYAMCIEPNGMVLPCQSWYQGLGNILTDPWEKIWNHPLCVSIRNRDHAPADCRGCDHFQLCGGGCPLATEYKPPVIPIVSIPPCF